MSARCMALCRSDRILNIVSIGLRMWKWSVDAGLPNWNELKKPTAEVIVSIAQGIGLPMQIFRIELRLLTQCAFGVDQAAATLDLYIRNPTLLIFFKQKPKNGIGLPRYKASDLPAYIARQ